MSMNTLRWIAVLPAAMLGWSAGLVAGLALYGAVDSFCPPLERVSGMCVAPWFVYADASVMGLSAGLAACLVVLSAVMVAPSRRVEVAWGVFGLGCTAAGYMAWEVGSFGGMIAAVVGGLGGVLIARFRFGGLPS